MIRIMKSAEQMSQPTVYRPVVYWHEEKPSRENFELLGAALAQSDDLFRRSGFDGGLLLVLPNGESRNILVGSQLAPIITDRIDLHKFLNGKVKASGVSATKLTEMLNSETFLSRFLTVDRITSLPEYSPCFNLSGPGYNDGGDGHRCFYVGKPPVISMQMDRINTFLDVMDFETEADRANSVAGLLTVMLRHHWPGGKPIILATATKSHSGKDTVLDFIAGQTPKTSVSWEPADWATQKAIVATLNGAPDVGVVRLENARVRGSAMISSAFVERFVTDPSPVLYSPGCGDPRKIRNEIVMAISTNFGTLSEDLLNRGLPVHLEPQGNVSDRQSPIGNPRHQYLPLHREEIAAEARGMIMRWRVAGMPLDCSKKHPCTEWGHTIGGILMVHGIRGFLDNYRDRFVSDDPIRNSIAVLGVELLRGGKPSRAQW